MTATVTTRVPEDVLRQLDEFSSESNMDRATLLRNLIERGLAEEKQRKILLQYKGRKVSLQKAAVLLGIDLVEMIELVQKEELYLDYSSEELKDDLKGL